MTRRWLVLTALFTATLVGCPRGPSTKKPPEPCKQLGQQCEFAPGKLGACSYRTECADPANCLYCQSQH
jgi:hypothetical protein